MRQHDTKPITSTIHVWKSSDEGETFSPWSEVADDRFSLCNAVVKRLASGRLLLPVTTERDPAQVGEYGGAVLYSDDEGRTWREAGNRVHLPMRGVMEPHVEETRDGRVLMVMRNQLGSLFISESTDCGLTRAFSNPGCRFTRDGKAIVNYWTCPYLPDWRMQDVIDLRVAIIDTDWFYGEP